MGEGSVGGDIFEFQLVCKVGPLGVSFGGENVMMT